ncbi:hypothetical protein MMC07_009428 [Pseudocyphellaria aurata]|nr:hypothetical protein [Pseudocyphellaria aurata]
MPQDDPSPEHAPGAQDILSFIARLGMPHDDPDNLSFIARLALARAQDSRKTFPFEKLPPEIRNRIYAFALINEDSCFPMDLRSGRRGLQFGLKPRSKSRPCLSMLLLNKAISHEATSFLYVTNTFEFNMSWLRSGGLYFQRDIRLATDFFSTLTTTAQFIRKVHVLCDVETLKAPAWMDFCQCLDKQLHLREFRLKIDLFRTYLPRKGKKSVPFQILINLLDHTLRYFSSLPKPVFQCTSTPTICEQWPCPFDSLEQERDVVPNLDAHFKDYLIKTRSTTLW